MSNTEHLAILKQGVTVWNEWRETHQKFQPDLRESELAGARLSGANLCGVDLVLTDLTNADLSYANFQWAHLSRAILEGADLQRATLHDVDLKRTKLQKANLGFSWLSSASFSGADLCDAILRGAQIGSVDFSGADLTGTDFTDAALDGATFANVDLSQVKGLETVTFQGPSTIGIDTVYLSKGNIPEIFLRGAGVPEDLITYMRSLVGKPIEFYSCFISYSSKDHEFAERLHADLQSKGVRCWFAPEDLKIGDKFRTRIEESIRLYDKLMVVLSENSIQSSWVEEEVEAALEKERQHSGTTVLFPIRLDDAVMETKQAWAASLRRTRHIGEFNDWKNHDRYKKAFDRLLRDLKAQDKAHPSAK
jgi:uncharacterized protein YjbI with pentapeptide repeats